MSMLVLFRGLRPLASVEALTFIGTESSNKELAVCCNTRYYID